MIPPDRTSAIRALAPRAAWSMRSDGVIVAWDGHGDIQPDEAAIVAELERQVGAWQADQWRRDREAEYPTISQLAVALWEASVEGRPATADELQQLRLAIKQKYPKPGSST